ncbi:MAG: macro domain-containing protein [Deltaproteobacteria bacterium]|jgi:O-acetyl-ADP-ribose deacetylase (regulator of RNase III)|nr:macro domain-containing protein [Deltaproteobacteria bacterium]
MLTYLSSSIWASPAQTLVNTVNVVGAMGKGIALEFKRKYPDMYQRCRKLCKAKKFKVGMLWLYKARERYILNFPTKNHWRYPSKLEYVEAGLNKLAEHYEQMGITSISFPRLGTGHGGLDWDTQVRPLMENYLKALTIPVYIHLRAEKTGFVPEHLLPVNQAIPFEVLLDDLKKLEGRQLNTLAKSNKFTFKGIENEFLVFFRGKSVIKIPIEHLRMLWNDLHMYKVLPSKKTPGRIAKEYALIFSLLINVPYIQTVDSSENYGNFIHQPSTSLVLGREDYGGRPAKQLSLL